MTKQINHEEIGQIVQNILEDYNGGKNIDAIKLFSNPDKEEVRELIEHFFRIVYPGYFRDRTYKIYNPKSSFAVTIEDVYEPFLLQNGFLAKTPRGRVLTLRAFEHIGITPPPSFIAGMKNNDVVPQRYENISIEDWQNSERNGENN